MLNGIGNVVDNAVDSARDLAEAGVNGANVVDEGTDGDYSEAGKSLERFMNNVYGDGSAGVAGQGGPDGSKSGQIIRCGTSQSGGKSCPRPRAGSGGDKLLSPDEMQPALKKTVKLADEGSGDMGELKSKLNDIIKDLQGLVSQIGESGGGSSRVEGGGGSAGGPTGADATDGASSGRGLGELGRINDGEQSTFEAKMEQGPKAAADYLTSDEVSDMELMELSRRNPKKFAEAMQKMSPGQRLQVNQQMKSANRTMKMISQTINNNHKTSKSIVGNMRV